MKFGVIRFPGSCDDVDAQLAASRVGEAVLLWHADCDLQGVDAVIVPGGFSYGDVLGAGEGWAKSILFHEKTRAEFKAFFAREDAFQLGVCNGCQMMSNLKSIIPGADLWPRFVQNQSERYEGRFVSLKIEKSPSVLFAGMEGSVIPIVTAHGEGYAEFPDTLAAQPEAGRQPARHRCRHGGRQDVEGHGPGDLVLGRRHSALHLRQERRGDQKRGGIEG